MRPKSSDRQLTEVLRGIRFPAPRWAVVVQAMQWGVSPSLHADLCSIPIGHYDGVPQIERELARLHRRSVDDEAFRILLGRSAVAPPGGPS